MKRLSWARLGRAVLDTLVPPRCLACDVLLLEPEEGFCALCRASLWAVGPGCDLCGVPLDGRRCAGCAAAPPPWDGALQAFVYGESIQAAILRLKRQGAALADGARLVREARTEVAPWTLTPEVVVPVPLHPTRARHRGFNQAALLGAPLAREAGVPLVDALRCTRVVTEQKGLGRVERARNLGGVYAPHRPRAVSGRRVLLVDDVITTGATARACTQALREAGAARVEVWALARVLRDS